MSNEKQMQVAGVCFLILMAFFAGHRLGKSNADKWWEQYAQNLEMALPPCPYGCTISPNGIVTHREPSRIEKNLKDAAR
jgi:hypothetical protein